MQKSFRIAGFFGALLAALASKAYSGLNTSEINVQGHRCLVLEAPGLPDQAPVVFILHGLGTNARDLVSLCEEFHLPPCRFVLPDAPLHLPGYPEDGYAWYDLKTHRREDFVNSRDYLFQLMDHFSQDPAAAKKPKPKARPVILTGFSQGGVMSLEAGLNYQGKVLAIVSMSGYIWDPSKTLPQPSLHLKTPILMVHGTMDAIVTEERTQSTFKALDQGGYHPVLKEFNMAHQITPESLEAVSAFLTGVLKASGR